MISTSTPQRISSNDEACNSHDIDGLFHDTFRKIEDNVGDE